MQRERWSILSTVLLVVVVVITIDQARFLFVYPVPDTGMWFGDETWTMLTLRELAHSGIARVPEAIGSSLAHSNGLINGSVWISGLVYGVPANLFRNSASPVSIGRFISFLLGLVSLWIIYYAARTFRVSRDAAFLGIFALVISGAFYFSSHSARLDMATGLAILLFFLFLLSAFDQSLEFKNVIRASFFIPLVTIFSIAVYVHVPALVALPALYTLWRINAFRNARSLLAMITGGALAAVVIIGVYWLTTGSLGLWGTANNQYYNVANSLPVLHLRSWRVQKINTIDRAVQVWQVAWPLVLSVLAGAIVRLRTRVMLSDREKFFFINSILLVISWGLFGGPAVFYNIYILPIIAVSAAVLLSPIFTQRKHSQMIQLVVIGLVLVSSGYTIASQERLGRVGSRLVAENHVAIHSLIDPIANIENPPIVLTDEPALNEISGDPGVRLMTNHLLLFGDENLSLPSILRKHHVNYLLLYSTVRWHSPFRAIADSLYGLVGMQTGCLTDQARSYDDPHWNESDTLRLYKAK